MMGECCSTDNLIDIIKMIDELSTEGALHSFAKKVCMSNLQESNKMELYQIIDERIYEIANKPSLMVTHCNEIGD